MPKHKQEIVMHLTDQQRAFLDEAHYAVLGTLNADGSIQQTVLWYLFERAQLILSIGAHSVKARNLRRNPAITLTIEAGARYLTLSGTATVGPPDPALRLRMAARYVGADRAAEWVQRRPNAERALVRITIARVYGQGV